MTDTKDDMTTLDIIAKRIEAMRESRVDCDDNGQLTPIDKELIKRIRLEKCNFPNAVHILTDEKMIADKVEKKFQSLYAGFIDGESVTMSHDEFNKMKNDIEDLKVELNKSSNAYYLLKAENERFKISDEHNRNTIDRLDEDLKMETEKNFFLHNKIQFWEEEIHLLKRSLNDKDKIIELMQANRDLEDRLIEVCDE